MKTIMVRELMVAFAVSLVPALAVAQPSPAEAAGSSAAVSTPAPATAPAPASAPATGGAPAPAPAAPLPQWSFGGGLSYEVFQFPASSSGLRMTGALVPAAGASLERRLSERSWFVLGVSGSVWRDREDVPDGSAGYGRYDTRALSVTAGVRRAVSRAGAPVEVSVVVAALAGVNDGERRLDSRYAAASTSSVTRDETSWSAGAQVGLALERELTDGLSVRVASPLLRASYSRGSIRETGKPDARSSAAGVTAALAPTLELRLQF